MTSKNTLSPGPNTSTGTRHLPESGMTGFFKKQVIDLLSSMPFGQLTINLPEGSKLSLGGNGSRSEVSTKAEITVHSNEFFRRAVLFGDIGFAESYLDGEWDSDDIRAVISWFLLNAGQSPVLNESSNKSKIMNLLGAVNKFIHSTRENTVSNSKKNIKDHYDLGNSFFSLFLDSSMTYSSALFSSATQTLAEAQTAKYERICHKLKLKPSDKVLEIGCGWGGFSTYAARKYKCKITAVTISDEQFAHVNKLIAASDLQNYIEPQLIDYRNIKGSFDKIVSIEMLEAVGEKYFDEYFAKCHSLLKQDGTLALQMITCPDSRYDTLRKNVDFIQKHIFPGSLLPSIGRVNTAINRTGDLYLYDIFDMADSYVKTLALWQESFNANLKQIEQLGFDRRFIRKWNYYFSYCQAAFDMRNVSVVQAIYTRPNNLNLRG